MSTDKQLFVTLSKSRKKIIAEQNWHLNKSADKSGFAVYYLLKMVLSITTIIEFILKKYFPKWHVFS